MLNSAISTTTVAMRRSPPMNATTSRRRARTEAVGARGT